MKARSATQTVQRAAQRFRESTGVNPLDVQLMRNGDIRIFYRARRQHMIDAYMTLAYSVDQYGDHFLRMDASLFFRMF
jgi:hypothetical protein